MAVDTIAKNILESMAGAKHVVVLGIGPMISILYNIKKGKNLLKFPKTIKVGGRTIKIIFPYVFPDSDEYCGQADYQKGEIRISNYSRNGVVRSDEDITLTLIHELIHWICNVYNGEKQFEEPQINGLTQGLYQVLKDSGLKF